MCHTCGALLKARYSVQRHIASFHHAQKCPLCEQTFDRSSERKLHLRKHHGMEEVGHGRNRNLQESTKFTCDYCSKDFPVKSSLRRHIYYKHKPMKCPDCVATLTVTALPLHRHQVHGMEIPRCGVCEYKHPSKAAVIEHQRNVHLKEKNVSCPHCELRFYNKSSLGKHLVRHGAGRRFGCQYCGATFPRRSAARLHERIHTGERRQVCALCGDRFVQKASLNYHMARRHPHAC